MKRFVMFVLFSLLVLTLISAKTVSQTRQVTNLSAFTKLYGYVKHFHPSDEAQAIDWDKFSVFGARQVQNAANDQELTAILKTLFLPVAPTLELTARRLLLAINQFPTTPIYPTSAGSIRDSTTILIRFTDLLGQIALFKYQNKHKGLVHFPCLASP